MLHIVLGLVQCRVTMRLTRFKLCTLFLNIPKHGTIMTNFQFIEIRVELENNWKLRKFKNVQHGHKS